MTVLRFKKMIWPCVPTLSFMVVMELQVDKSMLDCQFGARTSWADGGSGFFFVCDDLLTTHPTKWVSSKKWSTPVKVIDFSRIDSLKHVWYDKKDEKDFFFRGGDVLVMKYVMQVITSWVCGCGADLANRNFLIRDDDVHQVDLEAWAKFDWKLSDTVAVSKRTRSNERFVDFVTKTYEDELSAVLEVALGNMEEYGPAFFTNSNLSVSDFAVMRDRLIQIQTLEGLIAVLVDEKPKKKQKVDT